jgi:4,5-DOPA dioxygenase extradiol
MLPAVFVSHGAPTLIIEEDPARDFLAGLGQRLGRPQAVLVVSAHWQEAAPTVTAVAANDTIHDFYGFPAELYQMTYPAPGSIALASAVAKALGEAHLPCWQDTGRGLDHGAWVPLMLMYPEADIPVVQLSLLGGGGPAEHLLLGEALRPLRQQGVLVLASGGFTHNLREFGRFPAAAPPPAWVEDFSDWMDDALRARRMEDLLDYRRKAPNAARNHPTDEHLMPLFTALGAGSEAGAVDRLHASVSYGILRMNAYAFA